MNEAIPLKTYVQVEHDPTIRPQDRIAWLPNLHLPNYMYQHARLEARTGHRIGITTCWNHWNC